MGQLNWATSKTVGGVSEIAVLAPIKKGCVDNERRTYEERLRWVIDNLAGRHRLGVPIDLNRIPAIHFGRLMILRPEQYLLNSSVAGASDIQQRAPVETTKASAPAPAVSIAATEAGENNASRVPDDEEIPPPENVPTPRDDFSLVTAASRSLSRQAQAEYSSFLLTLVEFDGDLRVYMRDIAEYLAGAFDLIFENCENFPGTRDFELFWQWIRRYQINTSLFYSPYPNLSVVRIKQLEDFKQRFDAFVATVRTPQGGRATGIDDLFDAFLRENQQIARDFPTPGGLFRSNQSKGRN